MSVPSSVNMNQAQFPDLYKLPPMEFQSFDDWNKAVPVDDNDDDDDDVPGFSFLMDAKPEPEPEPDYSDTDSDKDSNEDINPTYDANIWHIRRNNVKDNLHVLSKAEYEQIVSAAESNLGIDIPEPDYHDNEGTNGESPMGSPGDLSPFMPVDGGDSELIMPKKLVNPNLDSREKQDLHREMMMNYKRGVDVLHQKSELKKKLEQRRDVMKKKEYEEQQRGKRSSFEVRLEEQANKLKEMDNDGQKTEKTKPILEERDTPEFLKVHSKINRPRTDS